MIDDTDDTDDDSIEEIDDADFEETAAPLSADLKAAAATMRGQTARFLVDAYYTAQDHRKRAVAQARESSSNGELDILLVWLADRSRELEGQIKRALDIYTTNHAMGSFMRQVYGIGPVISAGLLAHIYMGEWCAVCHGRSAKDCAKLQQDKKRKLIKHEWAPTISCPTVGHIWQFAGIAGDGQKPWEKGKLRPFNVKLKTLCWKAGQSFMKFSNREDCAYGKLYRQRKEEEIKRNEAGKFSAIAAIKVAKVGKSTEAYKHYSSGHLPPGHIDARARRWAVKQFLADMHGEWYRREFGKEPPLPYPIAHMPGHVHLRHPPEAPK